MARQKKVKDKPGKKLAKPAKLARFKATVEEARTRTTEIKEKFATMGKMWWELGAEIKKAIDDYVPEALGKKATEWMKDCFGDSWLKMYRANRAIAALPAVPKAKLEKISEGNAYQLSRLPKQVRQKPEWIEKAIKIPNEQFKEVVENQREKKGVKRDPMVKWKDVFGIISVPKTLADVMKQALKLAGKAEQQDLDTKEGRITALELIFSEFITSQAQTGEQAAAEPFDSPELANAANENEAQTFGDPLPPGSDIEDFDVQPLDQEYGEQQEAPKKKRGKKAAAAD